MKENPEQQALRSKLAPGVFSAEGFLGSDTRSPAEIIQTDSLTAEKLGFSHHQLAARMRQLTEAGKSGLGRRVVVDSFLAVTVTDAMGAIPCPFSDNYRASKQITQVENLRTGQTATWSDLNIHMIEKHGFYEGQGSAFRIEPATIASLIEPELPAE
jgi:hypothetical protein